MNVRSARGIANSKNFSTLPVDTAGIHRRAETGFGEPARLIQWLKEKVRNIHYDFAQNGCWIIIKPVGCNLYSHHEKRRKIISYYISIQEVISRNPGHVHSTLVSKVCKLLQAKFQDGHMM